MWVKFCLQNLDRKPPKVMIETSSALSREQGSPYTILIPSSLELMWRCTVLRMLWVMLCQHNLYRKNSKGAEPFFIPSLQQEVFELLEFVSKIYKIESKMENLCRKCAY
ncbi:hypothetical protein CEXT_321651 [Caerostris extrusa]|uniref:Uncharacterized protein n=1 Tax=Caerostris extrusa TaxID=172846 RepID=A0AAV4XWJ6_CAEEX|nr:hypothetical protein CEXT_321651 [Caerostris extrusa]